MNIRKEMIGLTVNFFVTKNAFKGVEKVVEKLSKVVGKLSKSCWQVVES